MYKVIFADDERLVRERIAKLINWDEAGYELTACCANGHEVMEAIDIQNVDLAILDINMPFISGIEAAKQIKKSYPHTKIVFLTGYTEFEYAKAAVDLGVYKYIVKPISADDFRSLLSEIKDILDKENKEIHKLARLEHLYKENQKVLLQDLLSETSEAIYDRVKTQGLKWDKNTAFEVAVLSVDDKQSLDVWKKDEKISMNYAVMNITNELVRRQKLGYAFVKDGDIVLIAYGENTKELSVNVQACMSRILHICSQMLQFNITVGLGETYLSCENISESYKDSVRALNLRISEGGGKLYTKEDLTESYTSYTAVWDAIKYIDENYDVPDLSVDEISDYLHISPSYLRSLFKRQTGNTIIAQITKVRMDNAIELLKDKSLKNTTIAEAIGYTDSRYFSYCFKRFFGMTTAEMRAKL